MLIKYKTANKVFNYYKWFFTEIREININVHLI